MSPVRMCGRGSLKAAGLHALCHPGTVERYG
jgi:hypothetical protein